MHLEIDRINIRLNGVSQQTARQAAEGLGVELHRLLANQRPPAAEQVHGGTLRVTSAGDAHGLRRQMAARIAASLQAGKGGPA